VKVLLVEDEKSIAVTLTDDLVQAGHEVEHTADGDEACRILHDHVFDCVITDVRLPGANGLEVLAAAKRARPDTEVLVMTGYGTVEQAVEAMRQGAIDYIQKPFLNESVGRSRSMQDVVKTVRTVAPTDASVLILGESGTGKERIARAIHQLSTRSEKAFVAVSCGALPDTLLETELFGHERGAFTDAQKQRRGRFELADGGTIFLDDIDDMPLTTQVKLLRVIQEREFERVGGERTIRVDIRLVSATKVSLIDLVKQGKFREDLYYRLNVVPVNLPPLRERDGDVPLLTEHFIEKIGGGRPFTVKTDVLEAMAGYTWPGNVRELENRVAQAIALAGGATILKKEHLLPVDKGRRAALEPPTDLKSLREVLVEVEREHLKHVLRAVGGHRSKAASVLGISRKVLWEKLKDYGIE
jgi:DNA-binding NtrC family response regulator